jgi:hypothetical protein
MLALPILSTEPGQNSVKGGDKMLLRAVLACAIENKTKPLAQPFVPRLRVSHL